jgi:AraC-like DNA-binding protein
VLDDLAPFRAVLVSADRYLLLWCHTGSMTVTCDGVRERLVAGQGVLVPPGVRAVVAVAPGGVAVPVWTAARDVVGGPESPRVVAPGEEWNDWILYHFTASIAPIRSDGYRPGEIVELLVNAGAEPSRATLPRPTDPTVRRVCDALLRDPACQRTATQWADQVRVGERTLHRSFVAETGLTFAGWRRECRLAVSRDRLLADTSLPVSRVAESVGFRTTTGFIRAFHRRFGQTPARFRSMAASDRGEPRGTPLPPRWGGAVSPSGLDHGFHLLLWVWRGRMRLHVGDRELVVDEGKVAWMPAYRGHGVRLDPGSVVLPLTFSVAELDPGDDLGPADVAPDVELPLLRYVMANQAGTGPADATAARLLDEPWVPGVRRAPVPALHSPEAALVADAVLHDLRDQRGLAQWAASVGMTPRTLNDRFRAGTGMTFLQWRSTVRLETALRLLAHGATPSDAARAVGYRHLSQFSRDFTAWFGVVPSRSARRQQYYRPAPAVPSPDACASNSSNCATRGAGESG